MSVSVLKAKAPKRAAEAGAGATEPGQSTDGPADGFKRLTLTRDEAVVLAVSGGGDSMALLHRFVTWASSQRPDLRLIAATVDHGLRPQSCAEAEMVADACARLGVVHHVLRWHGQGGPGVQARARAARYRLLAELATREHGSLVLTGHTADDQAETVAMRLARATNGVGIGLAGIDPATLYERSVWFARPLLEQRRAALRTWLIDQAIGFTDDPSNDDIDHERVRQRHRLAGDDAAHNALIATCGLNSLRRRNRAVSAARCLHDRRLWRVDDHGVSFDPRDAHGHPPSDMVGAWAGVLGWVGRRPHPPADGPAETALAFALGAQNGEAFTIAGCRLGKVKGVVRIEMEARNRRPLSTRSFDHLLVSADWPLAQALAQLFAAPAYWCPPLTI